MTSGRRGYAGRQESAARIPNEGPRDHGRTEMLIRTSVEEGHPGWYYALYAFGMVVAVVAAVRGGGDGAIFYTLFTSNLVLKPRSLKPRT